MANPIVNVSQNIARFGFEVVFNLELRQIEFSLNPWTVFQNGGQALCKGVNFEVIDPTNQVISAIDFPSKDIDPANGQSTYTLPLQSGMSLFGYYQIRGVIKDDDGTTYEVKLPPKQVCEPNGYDFATGLVPGKFEEEVNCESPFIRIFEKTLTTYMEKPAQSTITDGKLYYPQGTIAEIAFTQTPFETGTVYTGDYIVRAKTSAYFAFDDHFTVKVVYGTAHKFSVTCKIQVASIMCCLMDLQRDAEDCTTSRGKRAKELLAKVATPLLMAITKERAGKDPSEEIEYITKTLNCDCHCGESSLVQTAILQQSVLQSYTFQGVDATDVQVQQNGLTRSVSIKTKWVQVVKADPGDLAFTITRTENADNIFWAIGFDYAKLANTILTTIQNDQTLLDLFNSLVVQTGSIVNVSGLDGKCVIDMTGNHYKAHIHGSDRLKFVGFETNMGYFPCLPGISLSNRAGILAWINGWIATTGVTGMVATVTGSNTATGICDVYIDITGSPYLFQQVVVQPATGTNQLRYPFSRIVPELLEVLQALIDYLCAITAKQIKIGVNSIKVCSINAQGVITMTQYGPDAILQDVIADMATAMCDLTTRVLNIRNLTCQDIKNVFPAVQTPMSMQDVFYGTKGGACSVLGTKEVMTTLLTLVKNDTDLTTLFCSVVAACPTQNTVACPACSDIDIQTSLI